MRLWVQVPLPALFFTNPWLIAGGAGQPLAIGLFIRRRGQVARQGSAKPSSGVQIPSSPLSFSSPIGTPSRCNKARVCKTLIRGLPLRGTSCHCVVLRKSLVASFFCTHNLAKVWHLRKVFFVVVVGVCKSPRCLRDDQRFIWNKILLCSIDRHHINIWRSFYG